MRRPSRIDRPLRPPCHAWRMRCPLCQARPARRDVPGPRAARSAPSAAAPSARPRSAAPRPAAISSSARAHPPAQVRRQQSDDFEALAPGMMGLSEPRQQLYLFTLTLVDRFRGDGLEPPSMRTSARGSRRWPPRYDTAARGLIYEQQAADCPGPAPGGRHPRRVRRARARPPVGLRRRRRRGAAAPGRSRPERERGRPPAPRGRSSTWRAAWRGASAAPRRRAARRAGRAAASPARPAGSRPDHPVSAAAAASRPAGRARQGRSSWYNWSLRPGQESGQCGRGAPR